MTGKERAKAAFGGGIPDVIPIGEFAVDFDTAEKIIGHETYFRNKAKTMIGYWEGRRDEVVESWKKDSVELYKKLDLDIATAWLVPPKDAEFEKPKKLDESTYEFSDGRIMKYSDVTVDFTIIFDPNADKLPDPSEFENRDFKYLDESCFETVEYVGREIGEEKYIGFQWGDEEATMILFGGMENGLMTMLTDPEYVKKALEQKTLQANYRDSQLKKYNIDGVVFGHDFAHTNGPFFSPDMFRDLSLPSAKSRCESLHSHGYQVLKHACGNNWKLMDSFVEAGYDCYQSIQASASMDLKKVKKEYGGKMSLWGGVAVENLVSGTADDIKNDIDYAVKYAAPNGGFILGASHSIAVGSNYDNYMTMLDYYHKVKAIY